MLSVFVILVLTATETAQYQLLDPDYATVEVAVTPGFTPLPKASVEFDLNANGVRDEHPVEPRTWIGLDWVAVFSDVVSIEDASLHVERKPL
jgi:hypothetical protein